MQSICLRGGVVPPPVSAANPSRNQQVSPRSASAIVDSADMARRMHTHQRTKFKSTVVGCGGQERTASQSRGRLHHSRAGGGTMKRQAFSLVSLLNLLLVAGSAIAQTVHVRGNIPFNFAVGSKKFPAGMYDIRSIESGT